MQENQNSPPSADDHSKSLTNQTTNVENEKVPFPADAPQNDEINDKEHSQSKVMEVHKHPHHVTHKKKWLEYILEFLMIFLAVFLGFIAENIREVSIEQKRAGEYAQLLYDELKKDTANLNFDP